MDSVEQKHRTALTGLAAGLSAATMLFAALASAYIVRRGISGDWVRLSLPAIFYASIAPSILVSIVIERRLLRTAALLAPLAAAMHLNGWRELANEGMRISTNPAVSFFFVLDAAFIGYLIAGIFVLLGAARRPVPDVSVPRIYWLYGNLLLIALAALIAI
jgi:cytochrome c oxidase subunit 3